MADDTKLRPGRFPDLFSAQRDTGGQGQAALGEAGFDGDFARLKLQIIRPVFESVGDRMKERGHAFNITEEPGGRISIHIVPPGANQTIHPYDWFPTFSLYGAPFTRRIGVHGRNARPNSSGSTGERGDYPLAQVSRDVVEKELMKFIGEIANW
ncbi:MAG: hypothetical protein ACRET3_12415 [Burkholderiales bacterium]